MNLDVIVVPTIEPVARIDNADMVFKNDKGKV